MCIGTVNCEYFGFCVFCVLVLLMVSTLGFVLLWVLCIGTVNCEYFGFCVFCVLVLLIVSTLGFVCFVYWYC